MKTAKIEITYIKKHFNKNCGCIVPAGYEANVLNPEDFNCNQIYSQRSYTEQEAIQDIKNQLNCNIEIIN